MTARQWLALTVCVHGVDRPRLDGFLADWQCLGLVESQAGDVEEVTAHFSTDQMQAASLESLCRASLTSPPFLHSVEWRIDPLDDRDWMAPAREFFTGISVGDRLSVLPPWAPESDPLAGADLALRIEPGMAFGTGSHESTRLMLGWMLDTLRPGQSVLDLGAGSAILAIAAAKMGATPVTAVEIDPEAEENALGNIVRNQVSEQVKYRVGDFAHERLAPADLVLCNTLVEIFEPQLERLRDLTRPGGTLLLAGLLIIDEMAVQEGLRAVGLPQGEVRREGEWSSLCVRRR